MSDVPATVGALTMAALLLLFGSWMVPAQGSGVAPIPCPTSSSTLTINASAYGTFTDLLVADCTTPLAIHVQGDLSYGSTLRIHNATVSYVNFTNAVEMTQTQLVFTMCHLVSPSTNFQGQFVYLPNSDVLRNLIGFTVRLNNSFVSVNSSVVASGVTTVALVSIGSGLSSFRDGTASSISVLLENVTAVVVSPPVPGTTSSTLPVVAVRFRGVVTGLQVTCINVSWRFTGSPLQASLVEISGELSDGFAVASGSSVTIVNSNLLFLPLPGGTPNLGGGVGQNCYVVSLPSLVAAAGVSIILDNSTVIYGSDVPYSAVAYVRDDSGTSAQFFVSLVVQRETRITLPSSLASLLFVVSRSPQSSVDVSILDSSLFGPSSTNDPIFAMLSTATSLVLTRSRLSFGGVVTLAGLPPTEFVPGVVKCLGTATLSVQNTTIVMQSTLPAIFPVRIVDYSASGATDLCGATESFVRVALLSASVVQVFQSPVSVVFFSLGPLRSSTITPSNRLDVIGAEFVYRGAGTAGNGGGSSQPSFSLVTAGAPTAVALSSSSNVSIASPSIALLTGVLQLDVDLASLLCLSSTAADADLFANVNGTVVLAVRDDSRISIRSNFSCRVVYRAASVGALASVAAVSVSVHSSSVDLRCAGTSSAALPTAMVHLSRSSGLSIQFADSVRISVVASSISIVSGGGTLLFGDAANIANVSISLTNGSRFSTVANSLSSAAAASGLLYLRASNNTLQQVYVFVDASLVECVGGGGSLLQWMNGSYLPSGDRMTIWVRDTRVALGGDSTGTPPDHAAVIRIGTASQSELGPTSIATPQYVVLHNVTVTCNRSSSAAVAASPPSPTTCALVALDLRVATVGYWLRVQAENVTISVPSSTTPAPPLQSPPFSFLVLSGTLWSTTPSHPLLAVWIRHFLFLSTNITTATVPSWMQLAKDTIPVGGVTGPLITVAIVNCTAFYGSGTDSASDLRWALQSHYFANTSHVLLLESPLCISDVIGNESTNATTTTMIPRATTSTLPPEQHNDSTTTTTAAPLQSTTTTPTPTPTKDDDALALFIVSSSLSDVAFLAQVVRTFPSSCPRVINSTYNASATTRTILCSFCLTSSRDTVVAAANRGQLPFVMSAAPATRPPSPGNAPSTSSGSDLSSGAIAGAVLGSIVVAAAIGALAVFFVKKRGGGLGWFSSSGGGERRPVRYDDDFVMAQAAGVTSMHSMMEELLLVHEEVVEEPEVGVQEGAKQ